MMISTPTAGPCDQLIVFGNPDNKRTLGLQAARKTFGQPPAWEVSYICLLQAIRDGQTLEELLKGMTGDTALWDTTAKSSKGVSFANNIATVLRIDAPGENFWVERELIALGAADTEGDDSLLPFPIGVHGTNITSEEARSLSSLPIRILYPAQWFRGFCRLLAWVRREAALLWPHPRWMNAPEDIAIMFDKRRCSGYLSAAGVLVPPILGQLNPSVYYDANMLRADMLTSGMHRCFVKLFCGSGASGVIAYQIHPKTHQQLAVTTIGMEIVGGETIYYNTGRLRRYTDQCTIDRIINWLCGEGVHAERWIAKASMHGKAYDVRQLVYGTQSCHSVLRLSRTPITNLHLRNERVMMEEANLPADRMDAIHSAAEGALAAFPRSIVAGIDVLVPAHGGRPYVIDVNPFGDLLYYVKHQGWNTYEWEMRQLL